MTYLGSWKIDDDLTFCVNTHAAATGAATDADAVPAFRVYEDETGTPIGTGNMAKLDDANTVGFYSEQINLIAASGFEKGKTYNIYVSAAVSSVTGTISHLFQIEAEVDANIVSDKTGYTVGVMSASVITASAFESGAIDAVAIGAGAIDADALAASAIGSSEFAESAGSYIAGLVWDESRLVHTSSSTFGEGAATVQGNVTGTVASVTGAVGSISASGITASSFEVDAIDAIAIADNAIDAGAIAASAITSSEFAESSASIVAGLVWDESRLVHTSSSTFGEGITTVQGNVTGTVASVTGAVGSISASGITASSFEAGAIDSAAIATAAIDDDALAASAIGSSEFAESAGAYITDLVWDEVLPGAHNTNNTAGKLLIKSQESTSVRDNTAQSGSTGGITLDASAASNNDFYNHNLIVLTGGTGVGQVRSIQDYNGTTKDADVVPNWVTNPDNTSTFSILAMGEVHSYEVHQPVMTGSLSASAITASTFNAGAIDAAAIAVGAVDADALAASAIGSSEFAESAGSYIAGLTWDESRLVHTSSSTFGEGVASVQGNVTGTVASITGAVGSISASGITASSFDEGAIDAAAIADNAIDAGAIAASAITSSEFAESSASYTAGLIWDESRLVHTSSSTFGEGIATVQGNVTGTVASVTGAVGSISASGITASSFDADAVDAAALAQDAAQEIRDEIVDDATKIDASALNDLTGVGNISSLEVSASGFVSSNLKMISDSASAADNLEESAKTIVTGTVNTDNTAATTTTFVSDDITEATADHYNGRIVIWTSGNLLYQATDITDYSQDGNGEGAFVVTALTESPANNDTFVIV